MKIETNRLGVSPHPRPLAPEGRGGNGQGDFCWGSVRVRARRAFLGCSLKRMRIRPGWSVVAPMKPKHISLVVCSPNVTSFGGLLGLLGLPALLSKKASISNLVPDLTWIGSLKKSV